MSHFPKLIILLLVLSLFTVHCFYDARPDLSSIEDDQVKKILRKAIESAGGWKSWEDLETIAFIKRSIFYGKNGSGESEFLELHRYVLRPELKGTITWRDSSGVHEILYSATIYGKTLNGTYLEGSEEDARSSFLASVKDLFIPFQLLNGNSSLSFQGEMQGINSGAHVESIRAIFDQEETELYGAAETTYYFDSESGRFTGSMNCTEGVCQLIENVEFIEDYALIFTTHRKSFRLDSSQNRENLEAEYFYADFQLNGE